MNLLRDFLAIPGLNILRLKVDAAGIIMVVDVAAHVAEIHKIAVAAGWSVTSEAGTRIAVEPPHHSAEIAHPGTKLYHVSNARNHIGIIENGLQATAGGNTSLGRIYSPRIHLCAYLGDAFRFVKFQMKSRSPIDLNIYVVEAQDGMTFYRDSHFDGAIWTNTPFGAHQVQLLPSNEWVPVYEDMYPNVDFDGKRANYPDNKSKLLSYPNLSDNDSK